MDYNNRHNYESRSYDSKSPSVKQTLLLAGTFLAMGLVSFTYNYIAAVQDFAKEKTEVTQPTSSVNTVSIDSLINSK